jgi:hypothetical protein
MSRRYPRHSVQTCRHRIGVRQVGLMGRRAASKDGFRDPLVPGSGAGEQGDMPSDYRKWDNALIGISDHF